MSWVLVIWSMLAAACLTLALIHLPIWLWNRTAWPSLFFSLVCFGTAGLVVAEAWLMRARTPEEYATVLRWAQVPVLCMLASLIGFVYVYLAAGRAWLACTIIGLRMVTLAANFTTGVNQSFLEIQALRRIDFLGEQVSIPLGVPNPWAALGQFSLLLCLVFVADAAVTAWRRGLRGKALAIGGTCAFIVLLGALQSVLIIWAGLQVPTSASLLFLAMIAVMAYELSRDLLHARQLNAELGESEQRMVLAASAANLGIWSRDLVHHEFWANSQWRDLFGFTQAEPLTPERVLQKVHPEDRDRMRPIMTETEQAGVYHTEYRVLLPDGQIRWITSQGQAEFDSLGRPVRTRGASLDCTARKKAEHEMMLLRQEIAHAGRVSVLGHLASGLAHEINQPLGAILRNAEAAALFLRQEAPDLEEIRAIVEDIRKDDERAGAVIDRMRSLLRRQNVEMRPLAVAELFGDVAAVLRPEAVARQVKLDLEVPWDVPMLLGDRIHLQQVLLNLVSNGMDAIDESGRIARAILVSARLDGAQCVEIAVSDSGRGIAANDMGHIFEPFFTTKALGMGMGLSISRTIVEAHGGTLRAENHKSGARFLFTVPAAREGRR